MKKAILFLAITLQNICNSFAQKITNEKELKNFYTEYSSNLFSSKVDSIVKAYCTKELYEAWYTDVTEIGLYDPLTNGACEDSETMRNSLVVRKESDGYVVSFDYSTWDDKTATETVKIYVNADGKISHTKRVSDGLIIP